MVSVKLLSYNWLKGGRGYTVLQTRRKVATKQYEKFSRGCKYKTGQFNSKPGDVLQYKGEKILSNTWRRNTQNLNFVNERL